MSKEYIGTAKMNAEQASKQLVVHLQSSVGMIDEMMRLTGKAASLWYRYKKEDMPLLEGDGWLDKIGSAHSAALFWVFRKQLFTTAGSLVSQWESAPTGVKKPIDQVDSWRHGASVKPLLEKMAEACAEPSVLTREEKCTAEMQLEADQARLNLLLEILEFDYKAWQGSGYPDNYSENIYTPYAKQVVLEAVMLCKKLGAGCERDQLERLHEVAMCVLEDRHASLIALRRMLGFGVESPKAPPTPSTVFSSLGPVPDATKSLPCSIL